MSRALLITVRFLHGRYHGEGDWPPAPARLFQALVAGAARGEIIAEDSRAALAWLERLDPPAIAAPKSTAGQQILNYVPNNDLDAKGGDPARVAEIRTPKTMQPRLFDAAEPLRYLWTVEEARWDDIQAQAIVELAGRLYQLGRGIDPAFAEAEIMNGEAAETILKGSSGIVRRPAPGKSDKKLACPMPGSLKSIESRFAAGRHRFASERVGRSTVTRFTRPPRGSFRAVAYDAPPARLLFEIRQSGDNKFHAWPLTEAVGLVETMRDGAIDRLKEALGRDGMALGDGIGVEQVDRYLKGSKDSTEADKARRVRFVPLPSIGHVHADPDIRRVLVEVPQLCPIHADTIAWALGGLPLTPDHDGKTGELHDHVRLVPAEARSMLRHYGIEDAKQIRRWRTVTPAALPRAKRRRIDPTRIAKEAKGAPERLNEEAEAAKAVQRALGHAGIRQRPARIRVQREPWALKGARAEDFARGTRFDKHALWHVELVFAEPEAGPLIIGDGRWLGLGLMAPEEAPRDIFVFDLDPASAPLARDRAVFLAAARRAIMGRANHTLGEVPRLFSGHEKDGAPARSGGHDHIFLAATERGERIERLYVIAPWRGDRTREKKRGERALLEKVLQGFDHIRAGRLGIVQLAPPRAPVDDDPLCARSRTWRSLTPYAPTRHPKADDPRAELEADIARECQRRGLPRPEAIGIDEIVHGPRGGLRVEVTLRFKVAVEWPILLGRGSHQGGGTFSHLL